MDSASKLDVPLADRHRSARPSTSPPRCRRSTPPTPAWATPSAATRSAALPLEANNVVGLLSLQPGAVYMPKRRTDARTGAVRTSTRAAAPSAAAAPTSRTSRSTASTSTTRSSAPPTRAPLRVTPDSLQEFRVTTSNYGADSGRSCGAQVSLVTKSGTNDFHGSANWVQRNTRFSSNDYFLKLSQLQAGEEQGAKLDKKICGGALGGPIKKDKLFFFGNYERLTEDSESPVLREHAVDVDARRRADLSAAPIRRQCPATRSRASRESHAVPAGLPRHDAGASWPRSIRSASARASWRPTTSRSIPTPNDPGHRRPNLVGYRFAAPIKNAFNTYIGRVDYRHSNGRRSSAASTCRTTRLRARRVPGRRRRTPTREVKSRGFAIGWDSVLSSSMVNTFRYGVTQIARTSSASPRTCRWTSATSTRSSRRPPLVTRHPDAHYRRRLSWVKGAHTLKFGGSLRFTRVGSSNNSVSFHIPQANGSWVDGVGTRTCPARRARALDGGLRRAAGRRSERHLDLRRHVHPAAGRHLGGGRSLQLRHRRERAAARGIRAAALCDRRVRVLRAGQLEGQAEPDRDRRPALQPVLAARGR